MNKQDKHEILMVLWVIAAGAHNDPWVMMGCAVLAGLHWFLSITAWRKSDTEDRIKNEHIDYHEHQTPANMPPQA